MMNRGAEKAGKKMIKQLNFPATTIQRINEGV